MQCIFAFQGCGKAVLRFAVTVSHHFPETTDKTLSSHQDPEPSGGKLQVSPSLAQYEVLSPHKALPAPLETSIFHEYHKHAT